MDEAGVDHNQVDFPSCCSSVSRAAASASIMHFISASRAPAQASASGGGSCPAHAAAHASILSWHSPSFKHLIAVWMMASAGADW